MVRQRATLCGDTWSSFASACTPPTAASACCNSGGLSLAFLAMPAGYGAPQGCAQRTYVRADSPIDPDMASSPTARPPRPKRRDLHPSCRSGEDWDRFPRAVTCSASRHADSTPCDEGDTMPYTVSEAAAVIGKSKATVFRAIRRGAISAARDDITGALLIDPAELHRIFPQATEALHDTPHDTPQNGEWHELRARLELTEGRLADTQDQVVDLRHRLDQADTDRRQAL